MVLVGKVQATLNNAFTITLTSLSINGDIPVAVKFGPLGPIGTSQGCEKVSGALTFAVPATGLEVDVVSLLQSPTGFTLNFPIGSERHGIYNCFVSKRAFTNNPETGDTTFNMDFSAQQWVRIK
jgi:hypothetical protein